MPSAIHNPNLFGIRAPTVLMIVFRPGVIKKELPSLSQKMSVLLASLYKVSPPTHTHSVQTDIKNLNSRPCPAKKLMKN